MTELNLITKPASDGAVVAVAGDLDYANAGTLRAAVTTINLRHGQVLTLDLTELAFCDSSGITALITAHNHAQAQSADFVLTNTPANTVRVLRLVGLDKILRIQPIDPSE